MSFFPVFLRRLLIKPSCIQRGIDVVRKTIKGFARQTVDLPPGRHKIIILDEADWYLFFFLVRPPLFSACLSVHACAPRPRNITKKRITNVFVRRVVSVRVATAMVGAVSHRARNRPCGAPWKNTPTRHALPWRATRRQ